MGDFKRFVHNWRNLVKKIDKPKIGYRQGIQWISISSRDGISYVVLAHRLEISQPIVLEMAHAIRKCWIQTNPIWVVQPM